MENKSFGALKRLKSLYYTVAIAVPLLSGGAALAVAPSFFDPGAYYGSAQILRGDMSAPSRDVFQMRYSDDYQEFFELQKLYAQAGTVYYKLGVSGVWSSAVPRLKSTGKYDVYYYVDGGMNYNDLGSPWEPMHVAVNVVDWGRKVSNNGIINYVDSSGKTSAEIDKKGVIWVKEQSGGKSSWYGLDNSSGIFEMGSRFWVKWLNKEFDREEYQKCFEQLDEANKQRALQGKLWVFLTGVTKPDGTTEYINLPIKIPYYIQLGEDWNADNVAAVCIFQGADNRIGTQVNTAAFFRSKYKGLKFAENSGNYIRLTLSGFSPFAVYDCGSSARSDSDTPRIDDKAESEYNAQGESPKSQKFGFNRNYYGAENDIDNFENYIKPEDDSRNRDYASNDARISDGKVKFLIIEEIASMVLLAVMIFVFKFIYRRKGEDDSSNSTPS